MHEHGVVALQQTACTPPIALRELVCFQLDSKLKVGACQVRARVSKRWESGLCMTTQLSVHFVQKPLKKLRLAGSLLAISHGTA